MSKTKTNKPIHIISVSDAYIQNGLHDSSQSACCFMKVLHLVSSINSKLYCYLGRFKRSIQVCGELRSIHVFVLTQSMLVMVVRSYTLTDMNQFSVSQKCTK